MLAPADLEASVVNHEALKVAEGVEGGSSGGIDEGHEADVLVGDVADMVEQTTPDHIANLLNGRLRVNVAEVDGSVAKVVDASSSGGDGGGSNRLLSKGVRDQVTVSTSKHVSVAGSDA